MEIKTQTRPADDYMRAKVLERIGRDEGRVEFVMEEWDFGFCDTCSWPESGLAVKVDGETVYPSDEVLAAFGGNSIGDDEAEVKSGEVIASQYSRFFDWLDGKDLAAIRDAEDDA
ncbi:hypothetical protein GCM10009700_27930 [Brevibacterium sanguinis]|uniref:hypothetical protein n=1 Tax=Brevibacterium sanguinis TaxID=232444 RepID=UPI0031E0700D